MPKKPISAQALEAIKKQEIIPKPKWQFLLKDYVFWMLYGLAVFFGGIAVSVIIFIQNLNDWEIAEAIREPRSLFFLKTVPYFWLIMFVLFVAVSLYNIKHTSKGYTYRYPLLIISNVLFSIILGFAFFGLGAARQFDEFAVRNVPYYQDMIHKPRLQLLMQPEKGVLAGRIISMTPEKLIILHDYEEKEWNVSIEHLQVKPPRPFMEGDEIRILGKKTDEQTFEAVKIAPLRPFIPDHVKNLKEFRRQWRTN